MAFAEINGQRIHFQDTGGDGPAVVLSHGFLMDHEMFAPQVEALRDDHRVVTWDERGFGSTEFDGEPFTYWDSARDLLGLMDHLDIDRAVLGGMSQGGFLTLRAALLAPERVRAMILIDTQAGPEDENKVAEYQMMIDAWHAGGYDEGIADVVAGLIIAEPEENERWKAKWRDWPTDHVVPCGGALLEREDLTDRMGEIEAPALVIHGTEDQAIPIDKAKRLASALPGADGVVAVEGAAHAPNLTHPEPVNAAIRTFLADLPD